MVVLSKMSGEATSVHCMNGEIPFLYSAGRAVVKTYMVDLCVEWDLDFNYGVCMFVSRFCHLRRVTMGSLGSNRE